MVGGDLAQPAEVCADRQLDRYLRLCIALLETKGAANCDGRTLLCLVARLVDVFVLRPNSVLACPNIDHGNMLTVLAFDGRAL